MQLSPINILVNKDIFTDSVEVSITHQSNNANIYYTIDDTVASDKSKEYDQPIWINQSSRILAVASMDG